MEDKSIRKDGSETFESMLSPFKKKSTDNFSNSDKPLKLISITPEEARVSLFGSIILEKIVEEQRMRVSRQNSLEDMLISFPDLVPKWNNLLTKLVKGKPSTNSPKELLTKDLPRSYISQCYNLLTDFFTSLVSKLKSLHSSNPKEKQHRAFNDELILVAALGIHHTNTLLLEVLDQYLDSAEFESQHEIFSNLFVCLETLHEFFFALAKLRCNTVLHERHLTILLDSTKSTLSTLQMRLKSNFKLMVETPIQAKKLYTIAALIYYSIQTIALLSVFGEPEELTVKKYQNILERFKAIFMLVSQSVIFDKIFCGLYSFESVWSVTKSKYMLTSFNQKRLSIFFQENKRPTEDSIEFNLKYLVVYYNYKILKLISQRLQVTYDEHTLNIFASLIHKNRSILSELISKKAKPDVMKIMLYLNENIYIIKSYITNLAYFSDNLDPMQRQAKYDTIKDTTIDYLSLAIKSGMYWKPETVAEVNTLVISDPKDFVSLLFKTLLLYKKLGKKKASPKFVSEMMRHVNVLAADLISRPVTTDDSVCFYLYRLYFLQFLSEWTPKDLGEKYMKYSEEMSRCLADFNEDELDTDIVKQLRARNQELALKLYVGLAQIDFNLPIETTVGLIRENFTNGKRLYKYFYTLTCLFAKEMIPQEIFEAIMEEDLQSLEDILGCIKSTNEFDAFTRNEGMNVLFLIYKNIACSFMQTKEQRKEYEMESSKTHTRKSIASAEVNDYVAGNYIKTLDATIEAYSKLLRMTESFICALNYIIPIARDFLVNPEFNHDFYEKVMHMTFGRSLILKLLKILNQHLLTTLKEQDLIDKFLTLVTDIFVNLGVIHVEFIEEKTFILTIIGYLERLIAESGDKQKEVKESCFNKGVIAIFLEICQKSKYSGDVECFLRFLNLLKLIAKGNGLFYESQQTKNYVYEFVLIFFDSFAKQETIDIKQVQNILQYLIDITLEVDFNFKESNAKFFIYEPCAIETYFKILIKCFKVFPTESNEHLQSYVLVPLDCLIKSLMNCCILSKFSVQEFLMKILKRALEPEFQRHVSEHIGRISSIHTTSRHIQSLMRHFAKTSKYIPKGHEERYYLMLLDTLIDSISGDTIRAMYFFSGHERSFIKLKTPSCSFGPGLFWTGSIRYEGKSREQSQCIFSFLNTQSYERRGVELYLRDRRLYYHLVYFYKDDRTERREIPDITLFEDTWHHIVMFHVGNELQVYVNTAQCTLKLESQTFAKDYNCAIVGAATDPVNGRQHSFFFGEMSALYFFTPAAKFKDVVKDLATRGRYLASLYKIESSLSDPLPINWKDAHPKTPKYMNKEFLMATQFVLDPKYNVFDKEMNDDKFPTKGKSMNVIESLQETQLYFNRPAKDIFYNLGGFKTTLPLLASQLYLDSMSVEHDSKICCAILKLLHAQCINNDTEIVYFLIRENGINILKHLFEKVGKHGKFTKEFVSSLFMILDLPLPPNSRLSQVVSFLLEKVVFNVRVWSNSDYSVQKKLMERTHELLSQQNSLPFNIGEPYKVALCMLYDYFSAEEVDDPKIKKFLNGVRWELTQILIDHFNIYGNEDTVPTLLEFLLPLPDYWYSIRDLLYIILLYQSSPRKDCNQAFTNYLKRLIKYHKKEFDLTAALHILISSAIVQKSRASIEDPIVAKNRADCCEHIISYCVYILLLFNWDGIFEKEESSILLNLITGAQNNIKKLSRKSIAMTNVNTVFSKSESFLSYLNPARKRGKFVRTEEIILHFLFHNPKLEASQKESYNKEFLGEKTYLALLSHLTTDPSIFYSNEKEIQKKLMVMDKNDWNTPKNRIIYDKLIGNIRSFEPLVQQKILLDCKEFLRNEGFSKMFTTINTIYEAICGYLSNQRFLSESSMKSSLESFYRIFLFRYWHGNCKRIFSDMWNFKDSEFLFILNLFLNDVLSQLSLFSNDKCRYSSIQLIYFLEDTVLYIPSILTQKLFLEVLGKLIVYLNELNMLYFWYPIFTPGQFPRNTQFDLSDCCQREGGVVRVVTKLLLGIILEAEKGDLDKTHKQLALKLLDFFIFHEIDTLNTIKILLKIEFPQINIENENFFNSSITSPQAISKMNLIIHDKAVGHQKTVEEIKKITGTKKNLLENVFYRVMIIHASISQVLLYISYNVTSYRDLKKSSLTIDYRVEYLSELLGKIMLRCVPVGSGFEDLFIDLEKEFFRMPEYSLEMCLTSIDKCTKKVIETMRPYMDYAAPTSSRVYPAPNVGITKEKSEEYVPIFDNFKKDLLKLFGDIAHVFYRYRNKELATEKYAVEIVQMITTETVLRSLQPELHRLTTEDFLQVERMVLNLIESKPKVRVTISQPKIQCSEDKERIMRMHELVKEFNQVFSRQLIDLNPDSERIKNDKEYEDLRKRVLSEFSFSVQNRENKKVYEISKKYYKRLLNRCMLHNSILSQNPETTLAFNSFVKLDKGRDNINRAMRLKEIKHPLKNPSVLKGISYIRHFFLKRCLVWSNVDTEFKPLLYEKSFIIPDMYEHKVLKALIENCRPAFNPNNTGSFDRSVIEENYGNSFAPRPTGGFVIKACVSRTQLASECKVKLTAEKIVFHAEIVDVDHSVFGLLRLSDKEITFTSKPKPEHSEYRLGPTRMMLLPLRKKIKKVWKYSDIAVIITQKYNMIKQAMEIRLVSHKAVFLVLFSEKRLNDFFNHFESMTTGLFPEPIKIIKDCKKEFAEKKYTEEWMKKRLTNFEYLMLLNEHSSRSFQCMSQYPIFPWTLQDFSSEKISLNNTEFRNLQYPIAGITEKKRNLAKSKYENTDDFPGGRFQFGSHYLSGRAVLGYLMRLQPYTLMIYRFDSGGDCPSRCFHRLETMWRNITLLCDNNLELIPEFYYLPDFLANHNNYSFGMKQMEDGDRNLHGRFVRVDNVVIPPWAKNKHHFILANYLALEHPKVRGKLNNWIDLIFGEKQQKHEAFNLFKPLTSEKYVKEREDNEKTKLDSSEMIQIVEFGQNPSLLFEKIHPVADEKQLEGNKALFDILYEPQNYVAVKYRQKSGDEHIAIRVMPKDKSSFNILTTKNELVRKSLTTSKAEVNTVKELGVICRYFSIYNTDKKVFTVDPISVFDTIDDYFVGCRNNENSFVIYSLSSIDLRFAISFHKTIVNALHIDSKTKLLYTGDIDGVLAVWKLSDILQAILVTNRPKYFMTDHHEAIVSIDSNHALDLYVSASRLSCVLRVASTNRYLLTIESELSLKVRYKIFKVLLSARGYLVIQARSEFKTYEKDMLVVYSLNGERVAQMELEESLNAILFDLHQYYIITGGTGKKLKKYSIITLDEQDLHDSIEGLSPFPAPITSLTYMQDNMATLMVGLANSEMYMIDFKSEKTEIIN